MSTQLSLFNPAEFTEQHKPSLTDALACLRSIPNINRGGCGIAALAIYRWCQKNDVPVSDRPFVIIDNEPESIEANERKCKAGSFASLYVPHIVIEIGGTLVDSEGIGDESDTISRWNYRQQYQLNEQELLERINTDRWNGMFNRTKYTDIIAYGLDVDLDDVDFF